MIDAKIKFLEGWRPSVFEEFVKVSLQNTDQ